MTGFTTLGSALPWINKRPGAVLDYVIDLSDELGAGETLSSVSVTAETGLTIGTSPAPAVNASPLTVELPDGTTKTIAIGKACVMWLTGGTVGERYTVTVAFVSGARTFVRSFEVRMVV